VEHGHVDAYAFDGHYRVGDNPIRESVCIGGVRDVTLFNPWELAQQLCNQWEQIPLLKCHPRPDAAHVGTILECAYLASLETEESRPLKFGLILRANTAPDEPEYAIARFEERHPLSINEIRRLAPATSPYSTFIAVEPTSTGPSIWGTVDVGSEWAMFQTAERSSGTGLPSQLVITVTAPGTISVKFSDVLLYSVERARTAQQSFNALKFGPVHEFFRPLMHELLNEAFPTRKDLMEAKHFFHFFLSYGNEYLRFVARMLKYAEELGHGGTIIVVRESAGNRLGDLLSVKYPIANLDLWDELVRYVRLIAQEIESSKLIHGKPQIEREPFDQWRTASQDVEALSQRLIDRSRFLARLTQVDGALVLNDRLRVLGFGAVIKDILGTPPSVQSCQDELCRRFAAFDIESYGTRHRSALGLCQQLDCVAFVLSQDGGVKVLRREGNNVLIWPAVLLDPAVWCAMAEDLVPELTEQYFERG